jgi:hypothetical protein
VNGGAASPGAVALSLRLQTSDSSGHGIAVSWDADSPGAALVVDVIAASGGAPDSAQGASFSARFPNLQSALLAARRLQWALEGLAESAGAAVAASIAVHPVEDDFLESSIAALENVAPGRTLLSDRLAEAVEQLPGLALRPAAGGNWRELEWRSSAEPASFATDEQSVLGLIRALGREDPIAVSAPQPTPVAVPAPVAATASNRVPAGLGRSVPESEDVQQPLWKKPWVLVSAGAFVLVIVAVLVIRAMAPGPRPQAVSPDSAARPSGPAATPTATAPTAQQKPPASKPSGKPGKTPRTEPHTETRPEPQTAQTETPKPPPAGSCDLTETEIPLSLQRAARLMSAGKLSEAQDAYQRLVGCPSAHDRAVEGLRQVKQRIGFQGNPN